MPSLYPSSKANSRGQNSPRLSRGEFPRLPANDNSPNRSPANDNTPPRLPANDNYKGRLAKTAALGIAKKTLPKFFPYLNAAMTAYELWNWYNEQKNKSKPYVWVDKSFWTVQPGSCGGGIGYSARGLSRDCLTRGLMDRSTWYANVGQIYVGTPYGIPPKQTLRFSTYRSFQPNIPSYPTMVGFYFGETWQRINHFVAEPISYPKVIPAINIAPPIPLVVEQLAGMAGTMFPDMLPILNPAPAPKPIPYRDLPKVPDVSPFPQSRQAGNHASAGIGGTLSNLPAYRPNEDPPYLPTTEYEIDVPSSAEHPTASAGGSGKRPKWSSKSKKGKKLSLRGHIRQKPKKKEKELKGSMSKTDAKILRGVNRIFSPLTETLDVVQILYKNLPEQYRPRYKDTNYLWKHPPMHEKALAIFRNFDKLDVKGVIVGLTQNEIEDRIYAFMGQKSAELSRATGLGYGQGVAPTLAKSSKLRR